MIKVLSYQLLLALILVGCKDDPCKNASVVGAEGELGAGLRIKILEQTGFTSKRGKSMPCVHVTVLSHSNYRDTLFQQTLEPENDWIMLPALGEREVDIILDRESYFPVKINGHMPEKGIQKYEKTISMYQYDIPMTVPGEVGVVLKEEAKLSDIASIYKVHDRIKVERIPDGYAFILPFRGREQTRRRVERLCRSLLGSPDVLDARPLVNLTSVIPNL